MSLADLRQDIVLSAELNGEALQFHSTWGLFSPRGIDAGSALLMDYLEVDEEDVALDLGCGYGPLGLCIARKAYRGQVHLIDKDFVAVDYTKLNAKLNDINNVSVYLSNGFSAVPKDLPLTLVVSNLPAKVGNEFFQIAFADAYDRMQPGARMVVVTINGLRGFIKRSFTETFGNSRKLKQGKNYTVTMAIKDA